MNVQTLFETLDELQSLDNDLGLQSKLQAISTHLSNLANEPANPHHQQQLANALRQFDNATDKLADSIWPSRLALIEEIGGRDFFDPQMSDKIHHTVGTNAMTPSVARDFVAKLTKERAAFMNVVESTKNGIQRLGLDDEVDEEVPAEIAFLVPRTLFKNHLGDFARELQFINRLVLDYTEALTGGSQPIPLKNLSSSIPTISLAADLAVMMVIGNVVKKFLDAWKTAEEIREIRERLRKLGFENDATAADLKNKITKTVTDVADEIVNETMASSPVQGGRRNELSNALRYDTLKLYAQIERGLNVEVRVKADGTAQDGDGVQQLQQLRSLSVSLQFPQISGEPILLPPAEEDIDSDGAGPKDKPKKGKKPKDSDGKEA